MRLNFHNLLSGWHDDLIGWTRNSAPKLLVILIAAFVSVRILGLLTRKVVEISERNSARGIRVQQVRTVAGATNSIGVFIIVSDTTLST